MDKCISCIKPSKDLNKGYCGKCETVINNRLQKARSSQDHKAINDLRKNDLRISADKVKEYWVFLDDREDEYEPEWCFVDTRNGHTEWFESSSAGR